MSEEWEKQDRPCAPCGKCGAVLYEKFWGNGGWVPTDTATLRPHGADDCVVRLSARLALALKRIEFLEGELGYLMSKIPGGDPCG